MKRIFLALVATLMMALPATAQDARDGIAATISSQLEAFNNRDVGDAFQYASPLIQQMFGTADNFGMMVERGYPMVWDNAEVEFGETRDMGGIVLQRVYLRDANGVRHALDYAMIERPEGWRINGVTLIPMPDVGV